MKPLESAVLPEGIRARFVDDINGLRVHLLEAGFAPAGRPLVVMLHGFPELAYSWRKVMPRLAAAGYYVVAPDLRGYGRTTGWSPDYDADLRPFRLLNAVRDTLGLVFALGYREVAGLIGHDFGARLAAWCALVRPDVFRSLVLMSSPFAGPPELPFATDGKPPVVPQSPTIHEALAALPRPRKHYAWYYSTRNANAQMWHCPQGVHNFLRAYFHHKSADWKANRPHRLAAWSAEELAKMPTYYIMDLAEDMPSTVAKEMPSAAEIAACRWLPDEELAVYAAEFQRTGFQGGLNWYRSRTSGAFDSELQVFSGRTIDVPAMFIAGKADWGTYQEPGAFERMQERACTRMTQCHLIDGAGHWAQQEQPEAVAQLLRDFLHQAARG
ncbi:MAG: alpha/beta hydrolase [Acidobacteriia bacterium]|nr:alpha/beta hydrolase [Methyloceanibacter sp.]MBX5471422.1 alpha/beta hydrolase [Acetobacteraceae bacterium]MCL6491757.1 alpha/beta hydrolase [Terriglobia bacterium]